MIFFRKSFFWSQNSPNTYIKKGFSKKYDFWKRLRKNFLRTSGIVCRYLKCSLGSGLSFYNFRMVIRHFWKILLMKNENFSVFTKRDVDQGLCKGWKHRCMATPRVPIFFKTLNQKSAPKDLSEMFWRLFWYVSRGHRTNIGFGKR